MRLSGVSCSTCAWWEPSIVESMSGSGYCLCSPPFPVTDGDDWCAHWAHGRIEVENGRLVVREVREDDV